MKLQKIAIKNKKSIIALKPADENKLRKLLDGFFSTYWISITDAGKIKVTAEMRKWGDFADIVFYVQNCKPYYREDGLIKILDSENPEDVEKIKSLAS